MNDCLTLCLDSESALHPEMVGLPDENLQAQQWLSVYSDAHEARDDLKNSEGSGDVWVVSSDDVDAINLAAALKRDESSRAVSLVSFERSGSVASRAQAAGVELILGVAEFQQRYARYKQRIVKTGAAGEDNAPEVETTSPEAGCSSVEDLAIEDAPEATGGDYVPARSSYHHEMHLPQVDSLAESIAAADFKKIKTETEAFVVAVVSGSGGSGKSTLSAAMAVYYQMAGRKTLLLDADLQFGDMQYLLGADAPLNVIDIMADPRRVEKLEPQGALPALLASPKRLEQSELVMNRMAEMIEYLQGFFDVIVVNTGAFWSEQHAQILETADKSIFVIDQRPSSLRGCSHALELCARCGIATQSFVFLLNFCSRQAMFTSIDVSCALQGAHIEEINDGGKEVQELMGAGMPVDLLASKNPFAKSIRELCAKLLALPSDSLQPTGEIAVLTSQKQGWFSGLRKRRAACL